MKYAHVLCDAVSVCYYFLFPVFRLTRDEREGLATVKLLFSLSSDSLAND